MWDTGDWSRIFDYRSFTKRTQGSGGGAAMMVIIIGCSRDEGDTDDLWKAPIKSWVRWMGWYSRIFRLEGKNEGKCLKVSGEKNDFIEKDKRIKVRSFRVVLFCF